MCFKSPLRLRFSRLLHGHHDAFPRPRSHLAASRISIPHCPYGVLRALDFSMLNLAHHRRSPALPDNSLHFGRQEWLGITVHGTSYRWIHEKVRKLNARWQVGGSSRVDRMLSHTNRACIPNMEVRPSSAMRKKIPLT